MSNPISEFNSLRSRYVQVAPESKIKLIELFKAGAAASHQRPDDVDLLEDVSLFLQGALNASPLYDAYPALEEINDELLGYEDLEASIEDLVKLKEATNQWQTCINSVSAKLEAILP